MGGIGQQFARSDGGGNRPSGGFDSTAFRALELPGLDPKPQGPGQRRKEPKSSMPMLLAGAALLVVGMIVLVMMTHSTPKTDADDRGMTRKKRGLTWMNSAYVRVNPRIPRP